MPAREEYLGCGDHSCLFDKPHGQGTNGGCQCLSSMTDRAASLRVRKAVARLKRERDEALAKVAELEIAMTRAQDELSDGTRGYPDRLAAAAFALQAAWVPIKAPVQEER